MRKGGPDTFLTYFGLRWEKQPWRKEAEPKAVKVEMRSCRRKWKTKKTEREKKEIQRRYSRDTAELRVNRAVLHLGETSFISLWIVTFIQARCTQTGTGREKSIPGCAEERWTIMQTACQKVWFAKLSKKLKGNVIAIYNCIRIRHRMAEKRDTVFKGQCQNKDEKDKFPRNTFRLLTVGA